MEQEQHLPYSWSTWGNNEISNTTSTSCAEHMSLFFQDAPSLAIAAESSSHPSGLIALEWQPWHWAGGGLGNIDECPLQTCIAGAGIRRDSLTFASLCIVPECTAQDLVARDFQDTLDRFSIAAEDAALGREYADIVRRITTLNKFLGTGWTCGDFVVPWTMWPFGFLFFAFAFVSLTGIAVRTLAKPRARSLVALETSSLVNSDEEKQATRTAAADLSETSSLVNSDEGKLNSSSKEDDGGESGLEAPPIWLVDERNPDQEEEEEPNSFWRCFDVVDNISALWTRKSDDTAMLDGLRVGSICWIILGHVLAITGSVSGFSNPQQVFPPTGYLASLPGQIVLSSKFGVDTFLVISGFLTFHVLSRKLPRPDVSTSVFYYYLTALPKLFIVRVVRILPLYAMTLLFYTQVAPHLGGGPFWYQWLSLLKPCHDFGWTNLLFINNIFPLGMPTTGTCLYHSWYLALDMQLFLFSIFLVFWHQRNPLHAKMATVLLWLVLLVVGTYLAAVRHWSINTFDGAAVARYDVEAYAKPHIRGQCYLVGVYVSMLLPRSVLEERCSYSRMHQFIEALSVASLVLVTFVSYLGSNSKRPCQYQEWPNEGNCGSEWSDTANWIYASMSRTCWCASIGALMHLFIGRESGVSPISAFLSWRCWTPLSHLSFAVYLIHPILIFLWELGSREKVVFQPFSFGMNVVSICMVSYIVGLIASLTIEIPAAKLWKLYSTRSSRLRVQSEIFLQRTNTENFGEVTLYGSVQPSDGQTGRRGI